MRRKLLIVVLLTLSLAFAYSGWRQYAPSRGGTTEALTEPILSARRIPEMLAVAANDSRTRAAVSRVIAENRLANFDRACIGVRQAGRQVVDRNGALPLIPASSLKLATATGALGSLGHDATLTTEVRAGAKPKAGTVEGPLYIVGGGDPLLYTNDYVASLGDRVTTHTSLESLADSVVAAGVRRVTGGIVADDSAFDTERVVPSWDPGYAKQGQVGPIGALVVNQGFASFTAGRVPAGDPAIHAGGLFAEVLRSKGISVDGNVSVGRLPKRTDPIASINSAPVSQIVSQMLTESDNTTAELLLRNIGHKERNSGTRSASLDALAGELAHDGMPSDGTKLMDGSGLDRGDRFTCGALNSLLEKDGPDGTIARGLPQAGSTGTLKDRMLATAAVGRIRAKTGTLSGVSALAGWATPSEQSPLSFAIVNNGADAEAARRLEDRLAVTLATLTVPEAASSFAP